VRNAIEDCQRVLALQCHGLRNGPPALNRPDVGGVEEARRHARQ